MPPTPPRPKHALWGAGGPPRAYVQQRYMRSDLTKKDSVSISSRSDWRASKLIGAKVVNTANESIGDINDLLVDGSGQVSQVIVGVGGFLGIGEKDVALSFDELTFARDESGNPKVMTKATKESLDSVAEWKPSDRK